MNEKKMHGLPKAKIEKSYLTWALWVVPIAAAGLCAYFVIVDLLLSGPTVTIYFNNAEGLEEENTQVKYRGIKIGMVQSLELQEKKKRIAVKVSLIGSASDVARQGSQFWVVHPELQMGGISGLRTIVSGNYITVQPGNGSKTNVFIGLEQPPLEHVSAMNITLLAQDLGSLQRESPIFYRGLQVGEVLDFHLSDDSSRVVISSRIRKEYAPLVRQDSKFWKAGGINASLGLFSGLEVSAESAKTLVTGGIAFATPTDYGPPATNDAYFELNEKEDPSWENWEAVIPLKSVPEGQAPKNSLPQLNSK